MPDDTITLVSTTDSAEQVQAALTGKAVEAKPAETPAAETPPEPKAEPETPAADETPEQAEERESKEASEAGSRLAKRKQKFQQEIDELTRSKYAVRRDVEAEESRLSELRRQREEFERQAAAKPPTPETPAADESEPKLDALDDKGIAKYATYEDYLSDHAKWTKAQAEAAARRVVEEERKVDRERIERESSTRVVHGRLAEYNTALETFKKTHADFDAAFEDAKAEVQDTLVALGPDALRVVDGYTVFDAEDGPGLTYYLLKHPDELKTVATKPPQQQLIYLARLEERIRSGGAAPKAPARSPAAPETKAPEPIKPVGSGPTATTVPSDEESYQDYKARRERDLRTRRGA